MEIHTPTRLIGNGQPCYIIAEAGVHHKNDLTVGRQLIDAAAHAGADAIKFQTYKAETLVTTWAPRYWQEDADTTAGTQFDTFKDRDHFGFDETRALKEHCDIRDIDFLSTPFDLQAVDWLNSLGIPFFKIASADLTSRPLLEAAAATGRPLVLSTGAADLDEIRLTVDHLTASDATVALLHCVLSYPTPDDQANLKRLTSLRTEFPNHLIGYSDHTIPKESCSIQLAAVALGARIIEKHFTLDTTLTEDDHYHSFDPDLLAQFVRETRRIETALGSGDITIRECEQAAREHARRSVVAAIDIKEGATLSRDNLTIKRPGTGLSPVHYDSLLGKLACRNIARDELVFLEDAN